MTEQESQPVSPVPSRRGLVVALIGAGLVIVVLVVALVAHMKGGSGTDYRDRATLEKSIQDAANDTFTKSGLSVRMDSVDCTPETPSQFICTVHLTTGASARVEITDPANLRHAYEISVITEDEFRDALGFGPRAKTVGEDAAASLTAQTRRWPDSLLRGSAINGDDIVDGDLLAAMGTDGKKWAHEFYRRFSFAIDGDKALDEGTMWTWFANAIEAGRDAGSAKGPVRIFTEPDFGIPPRSEMEIELLDLHLVTYGGSSPATGGYTGYIEDTHKNWILFFGEDALPACYWPNRDSRGGVLGAPIDLTA